MGGQAGRRLMNRFLKGEKEMNEMYTDRIALKLISILGKQGLVRPVIVERAHARYGQKVKDAG